MWKEHPAQSFSDATGGESLERVFWQQVKAKNWTEVERRLAGNYVSLNAQGGMDRAATLEHLKQLQIDDYSLGDFQVELNADTLVVVYSATVQGKVGGQPVPQVPMHIMSAWQKQKAGWMMIARAVTR